jgi:DNA-binding NarL/FixJ family response regulator
MKFIELICLGDAGVMLYGNTTPAETLIEIDQSQRDPLEYKEQRTSNLNSPDMGRLALIESRNFLRECIRHSLQAAFTRPIETYSDVLDFETRIRVTPIGLITLSLSESNIQTAVDAVENLSGMEPGVPIVILSYQNNANLARRLIGCGARGYIPVTMGFEIAVEVVRFVLAGGTYAPADLCFGPDPSEITLHQHWPAFGAVTAREHTVARAIQQGKSNKVIAAEMHMAESTVKAHVRHLMKKLAAKNRTDVAIKTARLSGA